jgi:ComF family protein
LGVREAVFSSSEDPNRASEADRQEADASCVSQPRLSRHLIWAGRTAENLFAVLFPSDCRICGAPLVRISRLPVCEECLDQIHPVQGKVCSVCGERVLSAYRLAGDDGSVRCPLCRRIEPPFVRAVAYGSYDGGLRELIHLLKYDGVRPAANVLGRMLAEALADLHQVGAEHGAAALDAVGERGGQNRSITVIPVPLHKIKRRQRGFNQAELIAQAALKVLRTGRFVLGKDVLQRQRETQSQIGLTSHQRRENMRGAFAVTRAEEIRGREVLVVDDVYTTGTTVSECARVLRRAGASRVWVATVARTLKLASQYAEMKPFVDATAVKNGEETPLAKAVGS